MYSKFLDTDVPGMHIIVDSVNARGLPLRARFNFLRSFEDAMATGPCFIVQGHFQLCIGDGMRVLVTGGCGFLGFNLCKFYLEQGWEVIAYDNLAKHEFQRIPYLHSEAREFNSTVLAKMGATVVVQDVRDLPMLIKYAQNCDYICHAAAQPAMTISWEDPLLDFSTNTAGTFNVLETARILQIPVAVCSSIHVFGPDRINGSLSEGETRYIRHPAVITEEEPLLQGTVTPLHASKMCNEIYTRSFIDTYGLKAACFRLTGIYGPNQFGGEDHGWVANFSIRTVIREPITIFGTGKQLRDILFVSDVVKAFDLFYTTQEPGVYVLGGGEENMISLLESIALIAGAAGRKTEVRFEHERRGDLRYFVSDARAFRRATGWAPSVRPKEGIWNLVEWIKNHEKLFITKRT
jgi:CDP-paratose 2-epimerase